MRILQVAERTYPARGGVELHVARISEELVKQGHDVTVVVFNSLDPRDCGFGITYQKPHFISRPNRPSLPQKELLNGVKVLRFESKGQLLSYYWSPAMLAWLLKNAEKFDIMHTHTFRFSNNEFAALAHIKSRTPFVFTGHTKLRLDYMGPLGLILDKAYRMTIGSFLMRMAKKVIAFDRDYAKDYHNLFGIPNSKIRIIPNGIDYAYYNRQKNGDELKEKLGNPENVLIHLGRFIDYKRPDLTIASFKLVLNHFPNSRLLMLGKDYGLLHYCKKIVKNFGLEEKVTFIENASEEIKLQALSIADLCLVPSDYESFCLSALEAEASGVPVIASNRGGLKNVIEDRKTGLLLRERTPQEIAKKIVFLLDDEKMRNTMRENAKTFAKNFSWDVVIRKLLQVYEEVKKL